MNFSSGHPVQYHAIRVCDIYDTEPRDFLSKGKQPLKMKARSLYCFWAVKGLGMSLRGLSKQLELSSPAIGYSVERGESSSVKMAIV